MIGQIKDFSQTHFHCQVDGDDTVFFYRFHRDSFNTYLRMLCLVYDYKIPSVTLVSDLLSQVVDDMKNCSLTYSFVVQDMHVILDHKSLPLQLLSFVNCGRVCTSDGQVQMRQSLVTENLTLGMMAANRILYSPKNLDFCIENSCFIMHASTLFNMMSYSLTAVLIIWLA